MTFEFMSLLVSLQKAKTLAVVKVTEMQWKHANLEMERLPQF